MGAKQNYIVFENPEKEITELGLKNSSAQIIPKNSIVYSKRAPIGHINIVPFDYSTNQGCLSIIPFINAISLSQFYYFALKSMKEDIERRASGTTFKEISSQGFSETFIPLPPLDEQENINNLILSIEQSLKRLI